MPRPLEAELKSFQAPDYQGVPVFAGEFWTSRQRQGHSLHEISYRACFKAELPEFFISRLSRPGDLVYDPFLGRGTTALQAALSGRRAAGCDVNPLSEMLLRPRLNPPALAAIRARLEALKPLKFNGPLRRELEVFYHPETLRSLSALRRYFLMKPRLDSADQWIRMVCLNRLSGHSAGFFSVYTLPPNQAVSLESQKKINRKRRQKPPRRDVVAIVLKKSRSLLRDALPSALYKNSGRHLLLCGLSQRTPQLKSGSVSLAVTSPPFLDIVQYAQDNWLRCWFAGIDASKVRITMAKTQAEWEREMGAVLRELGRALKKGGHAAFEVGEVRSGSIRLEDSVLRAAKGSGLRPRLILINSQKFTKTANIWGVENLKKGTNSNRIVLLKKPA